MRYSISSSDDIIMVRPETMEECGFFLWLSKRLEGKPVTILFDTTYVRDELHAMLWIKPVKERSTK